MLRGDAGGQRLGLPARKACVPFGAGVGRCPGGESGACPARLAPRAFCHRPGQLSRGDRSSGDGQEVAVVGGRGAIPAASKLNVWMHVRDSKGLVLPEGAAGGAASAGHLGPGGCDMCPRRCASWEEPHALCGWDGDWERAGGTAWDPHENLFSCQAPRTLLALLLPLLAAVPPAATVPAWETGFHEGSHSRPRPAMTYFWSLLKVPAHPETQGQRIKASVSYPRPWALSWSCICRCLGSLWGESKEEGIPHPTAFWGTGPARAFC